MEPYFRLFVRKISHDDVIKWKHFPRYWPFVRGIHRSPVNSPHKGQWRGALMFTLFCVWINGCVSNREAGDLRCYRAHFDVTVMRSFLLSLRIKAKWISNVNQEKYFISMFTFELVRWANSSAPMYWECCGDAIDREPMVTLQTTCNISTANNARYNRWALLDTIYHNQGKHWSLSNDILKVDYELITWFNPVCMVKTELVHLQVNA